MENIIYFLKIFLPLVSLILIVIEDTRKQNSINKFMILLFASVFLKEFSYYLMLNISKSPSQYFVRFALLHYTFYAIYVFGFTYVTLRLTFDNKKFVKLYLFLWIVVFISIISIGILRIDFTDAFKWILRIFFSLSLLFTLLKINSAYFGEEEQNIVTKNKLLINIAMLTTVFLIIFFMESSGLFKNILELIVYLIISTLAVFRLWEGYIEYERSIKELEYEQEILLELLSRVGGALSAEANFDEVLKTILDYSVEVLKARSAAILTLTENKKFLVPKYVHGFYPPTEKLEGVTVVREKLLIEKFMATKIPIGETYLGEVAKSGQPLLIQNALENPKIVQTAKGMMDIRTVIVVPLKFKDEIIGVISFLNKETGGSFTQAEFSLAQTLAEQASVTLNNFRLYNELLAKQREEREIEIAGEIQRQLLPKEYPKFDTIELFGYSKAAKGVGGDYYDFLNFNNKKLAVIMADVAGKGVPASLVMVMIRSILRSVARPNVYPSQIVNFLNKMLTGDVSQERYATLFYYICDVETKKLYFTNAGHGPLLIYRKDKNDFDLLDTPGFPIGISKDMNYVQAETQLNPGDICILYTDGITEARNLKKEEFTLDRLKEIIKLNANEKSAEELGEIIKNEINEFVGEAPQHDDQTLVILKVKK